MRLPDDAETAPVDNEGREAFRQESVLDALRPKTWSHQDDIVTNRRFFRKQILRKIVVIYSSKPHSRRHSSYEFTLIAYGADGSRLKLDSHRMAVTAWAIVEWSLDHEIFHLWVASPLPRKSIVRNLQLSTPLESGASLRVINEGENVSGREPRRTLSVIQLASLRLGFKPLRGSAF